jgi:Fic family protein
MPKEMLYTINPNRLLPWNDLPLLPINQEIYRHPDILEQLGEAKAALALLQGRSIAIPNQGLLINTISLQEAKASSAIENIFTTDDELYKAYSEKNNAPHTHLEPASKEVLRYREALWTGHSFLAEKPGFDEAYFIKVFQEIKQTNDKIRPPFLETVIKQSGNGPNAGQVIYTPPRGTKIIETKLANLIDFVNDDEKYKIDPLLKMAIAHFQFEAIHPFRDGNGRTGRIFNIHLLCKKGLLDWPILFLSRFILNNKADYYAGITGVSARGDWHTWLLYMLKAVEVTANLTYQKINDIIKTKENILVYLIKEEKKIRRPDQLVEMLFIQPFTRVKHLQEAKIYAEGTARNYLNRLAEIGVLEKKVIEGDHYYLNIELYRILAG